MILTCTWYVTYFISYSYRYLRDPGVHNRAIRQSVGDEGKNTEKAEKLKTRMMRKYPE